MMTSILLIMSLTGIFARDIAKLRPFSKSAFKFSSRVSLETLITVDLMVVSTCAEGEVRFMAL